jgi:hypothetical protein
MVVFHVVLGAHMNIFFMIKVTKIIVLIKWSYIFTNYVDY